jgi:hypothetical protein
MEEEIYILEATLLEIPSGPLCNQRDARDERTRQHYQGPTSYALTK